MRTGDATVHAVDTSGNDDDSAGASSTASTAASSARRTGVGPSASAGKKPTAAGPVETVGHGAGQQR